MLRAPLPQQETAILAWDPQGAAAWDPQGAAARVVVNRV